MPIRIKKRKTVHNQLSPGNKIGGGAWDLYRDGISSSFIRAWLQCREKVFLNYSQGHTRLMTKDALRFGQFFHRVLELYKPLTAKQAVQQAMEEIKQGLNWGLLPADVVSFYHEIELKTLLLIQGYERHYNSDDSLMWIDRERYFKINLYGVPVCGIIDGIFEDSNGCVWLFESKTTSRMNLSLKEQLLSMDLQTLLYSRVLIEMFPDRTFRGIYYNVIRKPQLRQRKNELPAEFYNRIAIDIQSRPGFYFNRIEHVMFKNQVIEWGDKILKPILNDIQRWYAGKLAHYKNPTACNGDFGICFYFPICSRGDHSQFRKKTRPYEHHPEIAEV